MANGALNVGGVFATLSLDIANFNASLNKAKAEMQSATKSMESAGANVAKSVQSIGSQFAGLGNGAKQFFSEASEQAVGLTTTMTALGVAAGAALGFLGKSAVASAADYEQTKIALTTMMGSADDAGNLLNDIAKFAAETPFELPELASTTKQLMAFGFSADDATKGMKTLGDISAGLNVPIGDLAYLFGTLKAQGRAFTIDIRQFAMRGLPIYDSLAKVMKVSKEQVSAMVEDGKVGFPEVQKALESMTAEGGKFHGSMAAQATSLKGLYSTLSDVFGFTLREAIGINLKGEVQKGSIFDLLREKASQLIGFLDSNKENVARFFTDMVAGIRNFGQSEGFQTFVSILKDFGSFVVANKETILTFLQGVGLALAGFMAFTVVAGIITTIISPLGLIAIAVGSLAVAVDWVRKNWEEHTVALSILASFITVTLLPALVVLTGKMAVDFAMAIWGATTKVIGFIATSWSMVAQFVMGTFHIIAQIAVWLWHAIVVGASMAMTVAMTVATWALNVAIFLLTTPIGLVILAIIALIAIGVLLYKNWDLVKEKASQAGEWIARQWGKMVETVKGFFSGLMDSATEWGTHMMQNLANGIRNGIQKVKDEVDKVKNWIKDKLGFSYNKYMPSEIWGAHFMQNFADGISSNKHLLESQIGSVIDITSGGLSGAGTTNTINQTINAQLSDGVDVNMLGERMRFLMRANY